MCNCIKQNTGRVVLQSKTKNSTLGVITYSDKGILKKKWGIYTISRDDKDISIPFDFCPWCGKQISEKKKGE